MTDDTLLYDLLADWNLARESGQQRTPEELCRDDPSLRERLREHILRLEIAHARVESPSGEPTGKWLGVPPPGPWPALPGFEIVRKLGHGGGGVVYEARQVRLNRAVALKTMADSRLARPQALDRFLAEAEAVAALQHPHVVQIYEIGQSDGLPFFALELCPGGSLADHLRSGPLPARAAARLVEQVARGVQAAHDRGIVHRDLKPANILLAAESVPKVADFGLAKRLDADDGPTRTGDVMGTPSYMAPEQAAGDTRRVGAATDVYALGAVLYAALTGRPPFLGESFEATRRQVLYADPVPAARLVPGLSRDLETLCHKCLQKEPAKRYPSAAALADDISRWLAGEPVVARPEGAVGRAIRWVRRKPALAGLYATLAAVVVGVIGAAFAYQSQQLAQQLAKEADQRRIRAVEAVHVLARADIGSVPAVLTSLESVKAEADPLLREMYAGFLEGSPERLRFALALLPSDPKYGEELLTYLPKLRTVELEPFCKAFRELVPPGDPSPPAARADTELTVDLGQGVSMTFVRIPAGEFVMGSPDGEPKRYTNESPQRRVRITKDFFLGKHPVTQQQYQAIMRANPSAFCADGKHRNAVKGLDHARFPVEQVTWDEAMVFCMRLWWRDRRRAFRLPTEAEWEYACRGGTTTPYYFGDRLDDTLANYRGEPPAGQKVGLGLDRPMPVGAYKEKVRHPWDLWDMHGNVWQWCLDTFVEDTEKRPPLDDPLVDWGEPTQRMLRGGSWNVTADRCRSAARHWNFSKHRYPDHGFRVAFTAQR